MYACCNRKIAPAHRARRRCTKQKGILPHYMLHQVEYFIRVRVPWDCPIVLVAGCTFLMTFLESTPATFVNVQLSSQNVRALH